MPPVVPPVKTCPTCLETKSSREFYQNAGRADGLSTYCADCTSEYNKNRDTFHRHYHANATKAKAATRKWYEEHPVEWRAMDYARKYNVSMDWYQGKLKEQGGVCAICRRPQSARNGVPRWLAIDHDHACCPHRGRSCGRCVRGLLCTACNTRLAALEDEVWRESADAYLRHHKQESA